MHRTTLRRVSLPATLAASLCAFLTSCGGGSDAGSPAPPGATSANPPASAPVVGGATASTSTCSLSSFQTSLLARINQVRATGADCGGDTCSAPLRQ